MTQINMQEAKTNFAQLIKRALHGEDIVISRYGKPLLRLVPIGDTPETRPSGLHLLDLNEIDWFQPLSDQQISEWYDAGLEPLKTSKAKRKS